MKPLVLFTAGAPGVGKSHVLHRLIEGLPIVSNDADAVLDEIAGEATGDARDALLPRAIALVEERQELLIATRQSHVVNTTAADLDWLRRLYLRLSHAGFRCLMIVVRAPLKTAVARNSGRTHPVPEDVLRAKAAAVAANLDSLQELFAPDFWIVDNDDRDLGREIESVRAILERSCRS